MITLNADGTFDLRSESQRMIDDLTKLAYDRVAKTTTEDLLKHNALFQKIHNRNRIILDGE